MLRTPSLSSIFLCAKQMIPTAQNIIPVLQLVNIFTSNPRIRGINSIPQSKQNWKLAKMRKEEGMSEFTVLFLKEIYMSRTNECRSTYKNQ